MTNFGHYIVRTNPEVAKYFEECNQFRERSWEMLCSHAHSLSANQELKYIQFEHEVERNL